MCRLVFLSHEELLSLQWIIYIGRSESLQLVLEFILGPSVDFSPQRPYNLMGYNENVVSTWKGECYNRHWLGGEGLEHLFYKRLHCKSCLTTTEEKDKLKRSGRKQW